MRRVATQVLAGVLTWSLALGATAAPAEPEAAESESPPPPPPPTPTSTKSSPPAGSTGGPGAGDASEVVVRASLEIDTTAAGPAGPVIFSRLDELGNRQLRRAEVLPGRTAKDPVIRIEVREIGGEQPGYAISSALLVDGAPFADSQHATECRLCTEGEAVERATSEIERLVPLARERAQAQAQRAAVKPGPEPPPKVDTGPVRPGPLGARGKAGIGLLAGGAVLLGVGIGLAVNPPRPDKDDPLRSISTRPAGYGILGVGAAALITGAVLLGLDRRAANRRVTWAPGAAPGSAGIVISGSF